MRAIDSCGGRVTIGDVAGKAGLKLNEAEKALQAIAADTGGFLEVVFAAHACFCPCPALFLCLLSFVSVVVD